MIGKHRILILGGSGFVGSYLYSELRAYYDSYGTYCEQSGRYEENQAFFQYCAEKDSITSLLEKVQPSIVISCFNATTEAELQSHRDISSYVARFSDARLIFLSTHEVFSAQREHPSYEYDPTLSDTSLGKRKAAVEKLVNELLPNQSCIARLPYIFGVHSPSMMQLRQAIRHQATYEVFPNKAISVTIPQKIAQQLHYIINQELTGYFHLASSDMVHHEDFLREICEKLGDEMPIFKSVFTRNEDEYDAILPKYQLLPETYSITVSAVVEDCTLKEAIETFKP
ncbi:sugar nucleotide-binding protein [Flavobacteriaceae bacterium TK19130]|nr:sugar nucleotide-binding protein [Thermobacterium salinum]